MRKQKHVRRSQVEQIKVPLRVWKIQMPMFSSHSKPPLLVYDENHGNQFEVPPGNDTHAALLGLFDDDARMFGKVYVRALITQAGMFMVEETLKFPEDPETDF